MNDKLVFLMKIVLQREKQMNFENKKSGFVKTCDELVNSPLKDQTNRQPSLTVEEIKTGIFSTDFKEAFKATQAARKILSRERNPPIDVLIDAGIGT